ncbi:MAG TPA: GNAT family N-acetyltransferase [Bryobacteraceae bacterium]|nr:GNAT family N-acetyltransferase [Bryobacteraceae bacterium]
MASAAPDLLSIRPATESDVALILSFIEKLAEYEKLSHEVVATQAALRKYLFGPRPMAEVILAHWGSQPAGFALYFHNFSTFLARPGIYLEDLFVEPEYRGKGIGKALLVSLARIAMERGCGRLEWSVLNWNEPSIQFYQRLGAVAKDDWTIYRLTGDALQRLATGSLS